MMRADRDFDKVIDRRNTCSYKWGSDKYGFDDDKIIPVWTADMDFRCAEPIVKAVIDRAEHGLFGYPMRDQAHKD